MICVHITPFDTHRIFKRLAKALISLSVCAGWSEPLLVAHTTLLEISCHASFLEVLGVLGNRVTSGETKAKFEGKGNTDNIGEQGTKTIFILRE